MTTRASAAATPAITTHAGCSAARDQLGARASPPGARAGPARPGNGPLRAAVRGRRVAAGDEAGARSAPSPSGVRPTRAISSGSAAKSTEAPVLTPLAPRARARCLQVLNRLAGAADPS